MVTLNTPRRLWKGTGERVRVGSYLDVIQNIWEVFKAALCQVWAQFKLQKEILFLGKKKKNSSSDEKTEWKGRPLFFFSLRQNPFLFLLSNNIAAISYYLAEIAQTRVHIMMSDPFSRLSARLLLIEGVLKVILC